MSVCFGKTSYIEESVVHVTGCSNARHKQSSRMKSYGTIWSTAQNCPTAVDSQGSVLVNFPLRRPNPTDLGRLKWKWDFLKHLSGYLLYNAVTLCDEKERFLFRLDVDVFGNLQPGQENWHLSRRQETNIQLSKSRGSNTGLSWLCQIASDMAGLHL